MPNTSDPFTATLPLTAALPRSSDTRTTPWPPTPQMIILISFFVAILHSRFYCIVRADLGADPTARAPGSIDYHLAFINNQGRTAQQIDTDTAVAGKAALRFSNCLFFSQAGLHLFEA